MREELQEIIKNSQYNNQYDLFEQNQYSQYLDGENHHILSFYQQELSKMKNKVKLLKETIQSLLQYGVRMNKLYQQTINQGIIHFNTLKEEKQQRQHLLNEQAHQSKRITQELLKQIEVMKKQIIYQQENQRTILEKYQEIIQRENLTYEQYHKDIVQMESHFNDSIKQMRKNIQIKQHTLFKFIKQNEIIKLRNLQIQAQKDSIKAQNETLKEKIMYSQEQEIRLLNKNQRLQKQINVLQQKIDDLMLMKLGNKCEDVQSIRSEQKFTLEINKTNGLRYIVNFNEEKELLNISENYIQSLQSFRAKFNQSQQHIDEAIARRSKFIKNTIFQILEKEEEIADKSIKKQMPLIQSQTKSIHTPDPYESFFSLLVQTQKLNSPHFNKIAHANLAHLYRDFVQKTIPFNKWQAEIKKYLESKHSLVKARK